MSFINKIREDKLLLHSIVCVFFLAVCHWIQFYRSGYLIQPLIRSICATTYILVAFIFGRKSWSVVLFVWAMALVYFNRFCNFTSFIMILIAVNGRKKFLVPCVLVYSIAVIISLYLYKDSFTHLLIHAGGCYFFFIVYKIIIQKIESGDKSFTLSEEDKKFIDSVSENKEVRKELINKTEAVMKHLSALGRNDKEKLIKESSLSDREVSILTLRYVNGYSLKESSEKLNMEYDTFTKAQKRAIDKLYSYLFTK